MPHLADAIDVLGAIDVLADRWVLERDDRFRRRHLEAEDFRALAETGFLRLVVPESHGGFWRSLATTGPVIADAICRLARGDQSVALVASMHPTIMAMWSAAPPAPEAHASAWHQQQSEVFQSALDGHYWGTIASEPGSGGDIMLTKAIARPIVGPGSRFSLHGAKHFGSGSQMVSYMITTAKPDGAHAPVLLYVDLRDQTWDGTGGLTITREWDGMGMKATQSHAVMLDGVEGVPFAWPEAVAVVAPPAATLGVVLFCSVILSVVDAAMAETEKRLAGKTLRPYEEVALAQAQVDHWMITQAQRGAVDALVNLGTAEAAIAAVKAKTGMAATAESILTGLCRAIGGSAFSASSPFATWNEDVRALGFLRPPWALAFDQIIAARQS